MTSATCSEEFSINDLPFINFIKTLLKFINFEVVVVCNAYCTYYVYWKNILLLYKLEFTFMIYQNALKNSSYISWPCKFLGDTTTEGTKLNKEVEIKIGRIREFDICKKGCNLKT